jgi:hypothetical protein
VDCASHFSETSEIGGLLDRGRRKDLHKPLDSVPRPLMSSSGAQVSMCVLLSICQVARALNMRTPDCEVGQI